MVSVCPGLPWMLLITLWLNLNTWFVVFTFLNPAWLRVSCSLVSSKYISRSATIFSSMLPKNAMRDIGLNDAVSFSFGIFTLLQ